MKLYKIKKSKIDKNGLYASCDIKKGTRIIEDKENYICKKVKQTLNLITKKLFIFLISINVLILMEILNLILPD